MSPGLGGQSIELIHQRQQQRALSILRHGAKQLRESVGWENERRRISIWMNEQRCNGFLCQIDEQSISFEGVTLDRYVGQYRDTCFVYQCERAPDTRRKF